MTDPLHRRMTVEALRAGALLATVIVAAVASAATWGAELTVRLPNWGEQVRSVGAVERWDADGNPRRPVDPKQRIDAPFTNAQAKRVAPGVWRFEKLPAGRYDLIVFLEGNLRVDGFSYPPILEFDPFAPHQPGLASTITEKIERDIGQSKHYENKVRPLFMSGDEKSVRVLVELLRDEPTSYDAEYGQPIATLRYEFWQFTNRYGAWTKEKRTRVVTRVLLPKKELAQWKWQWEPSLGGIEVKDEPVDVTPEVEAKVVK